MHRISVTDKPHHRLTGHLVVFGHRYPMPLPHANRLVVLCIHLIQTLAGSLGQPMEVWVFGLDI
jgi:hypothetical protein